MSFSDRVIRFNQNLHYEGSLPAGFAVLNPFRSNPETMQVMQQFYKKFYNDEKKRRFIIGINPGRWGAGLTGVPFTDTKRLDAVCGIKMDSAYSHEPSSVFVYEVIERFGGVRKFYGRFYINSPFPLAIIRQNGDGKWVNANYYDDRELMSMTESFMIDSLNKHISLGLDTSEVYVLGKKNAEFIVKLNKKKNFFENIVILDHPRYIQQYKSKEKEAYLDQYLSALKGK